MQNTRFLLLATLGLLIVSGLVAGFFTGSMQRILAAPMMMPVGVQSATARTMSQIATPAGTQAVAPTATIPAGIVPQVQGTVLARDTFQRGDQLLWGTASDGNPWQGDASKAPDFSITGGMGKIAGKPGVFNALLGTTASNVDVVLTGSLSSYVDQANLGVVLRWTDVNNWYKALIDGKNLSIIRRVNGGNTRVLATMPFTALGGVSYSIRFHAVGANLFARAWRSDTAEPTQLMLPATDTDLTSGKVGVRVVVQDGVEVNVTAFMATTAMSPISN